MVLVLAPGADGPTVNGVTRALKGAGAIVTGQVVLSSQFFDTGATTEQQLETTATSLAPTGLTLPNSSADPQVSGQQAAAQVLAATLVNKIGVPTLSPQQIQQILTGFANAGFLQINGPAGGTVTGRSGDDGRRGRARHRAVGQDQRAVQPGADRADQ